MGLHLDSFEIDTFRALIGYAEDDLGAWVAFTGKNGTGKSSIVEGLSELGAYKMHRYADIPAGFPMDEGNPDDVEVRFSYLFRLDEGFWDLFKDGRVRQALVSYYQEQQERDRTDEDHWSGFASALQSGDPLEKRIKDTLYGLTKKNWDVGPYSELLDDDGSPIRPDSMVVDAQYLQIKVELSHSDGPYFEFSILDDGKDEILPHQVFHDLMHGTHGEQLRVGEFGLTHALLTTFVHCVTNVDPTDERGGGRVALLEPDGKNLSSYIEHCLLHDSRYLDDVSESFETVFGSSIAFQKDDGSVSPAEDVILFTFDDGDPIGLSKLSGGQRRGLRILLQLEASEPGDILLIDEPELHMHPGAAKRLRKKVTAKEGVQVLVATHSPIFFDPQVADRILVHRMPGSVVEAERMDGSEVDEALKSVGASGSDVLQYDYVVWVEGPSDQIYLREFASLSADIFGYKDVENIGFQRLGGGETEHTDPSNLRAICRKSVVLLDGDGGAVDDVDAFRSKLEDGGVGLHVWRRKSVEHWIPEQVFGRVFPQEFGPFEFDPDDDIVALLRDRELNITKTGLADCLTAELEWDDFEEDSALKSELEALSDKLDMGS